MHAYPVLHTAPSPSAPLNLTFTPGGVLNNSITLTWLPPQHPNGVLQFYQLRLLSSDGLTFVNTSDNTTTAVLSLNSALVSQKVNLTPGKQYNISVRAFTVTFGPFSTQLSVWTADGEGTYRTLLFVTNRVHCFEMMPLLIHILNCC